MRVRNKEIRARRHRKEQAIKAAVRDAKANATGAEKKPAAPKVEKKAAEKKPAAKKPAAKKPATKAKKADAPTEE